MFVTYSQIEMNCPSCEMQVLDIWSCLKFIDEMSNRPFCKMWFKDMLLHNCIEMAKELLSK